MWRRVLYVLFLYLHFSRRLLKDWNNLHETNIFKNSCINLKELIKSILKRIIYNNNAKDVQNYVNFSRIIYPSFYMIKFQIN